MSFINMCSPTKNINENENIILYMKVYYYIAYFRNIGVIIKRK